MTLRYAKLASPTIRSAYQNAMDKVRAGQLLPLTVVGGAPTVPDKVQWLHAEMLKTRLPHGFCARPKAAGPCPYANICEQCDFFVPDPSAEPVISAQLDDVHALHADAQAQPRSRPTRTRPDQPATAAPPATRHVEPIMRHLRREYTLVLAGEWLGMTGHLQPDLESGARTYAANLALRMEDPDRPSTRSGTVQGGGW